MSIGALLFGLLSSSLVWATVVRLLWGIFGVDVPLARTLACDGYEKNNRSKALHYSSLFANVGSSLGFVFAGYLSTLQDRGANRFAFLPPCIAVVIIASIAALVQCLFLKEAWHHFRASAVSVRNRLGRGTSSAGPYAAVRAYSSPWEHSIELDSLHDDNDEEAATVVMAPTDEEWEGSNANTSTATGTSSQARSQDSRMNRTAASTTSSAHTTPSSPFNSTITNNTISVSRRRSSDLTIASASAAIGRHGPLSKCGSEMGQVCACTRLCRCSNGGLGIHFVVAAIVGAAETTTLSLFPIWAMRPWHGGGFSFSLAQTGSFYVGCAVPVLFSRLFLRRCFGGTISERFHRIISLIACAMLLVIVPHASVLCQIFQLPRPLSWLLLLLLWTTFVTIIATVRGNLLICVNDGCGDDLRGAANRTLYVSSAAWTATVIMFTNGTTLSVVRFFHLEQSQWPLYELAWYIQASLLLTSAFLCFALPTKKTQNNST